MQEFEDTIEDGLLRAGNTVETLRPKSVLPSAEDLDSVAEEKKATVATAVSSTVPVATADPLDDENTFDVSRAEFSELQDAFLRIQARIEKFNQGSPHKI